MHPRVGKVREAPGGARRDDAVIVDLHQGLLFPHQSPTCLQFRASYRVPGIVRVSRANSHAHQLKPMGVAELEPDGDGLRAGRIGGRREELDYRASVHSTPTSGLK